MTQVELQIRGEGILDKTEAVTARLARVPAIGERIEFSEEYADENLAGEVFNVEGVIWPLDEEPLASIDRDPVLVLRVP
jgi:hypothetical protein